MNLEIVTVYKNLDDYITGVENAADSFALSFYPNLKPKWLYDMSENPEKFL